MKVIVTLVFSVIWLSVQAQPCQLIYSQSMEKGKQYLNSNPPEFRKALTEFQAAQIAARECCFSTADAAIQLKKVFDGLQRQREQAIDDRKIAEREKRNAEAASARAKTEAENALKEKATADLQRKKADAALEQQRKSDSARELATLTSKEAEKAKHKAEQKLDSIKALYNEKTLLVIANSKGAPDKLDSNYMLSIFRGEIFRWPGGIKITTALISPENELGANIAHSVFHVGKERIARYFRLLEYQGGQYSLFNSPAQLEEFIAETRGAIGIINRPPTTPNVKIVSVEPKETNPK